MEENQRVVFWGLDVQHPNRADPQVFQANNDLYAAHKSAVAKEALERIAALYVIEEEIRGRSAEERREIRDLRSRPLLDSLKQWFQETLGKLSTKSDNTKAIRYALGRWNELMRFCDDGHLEIDNSAAERSLVLLLG